MSQYIGNLEDGLYQGSFHATAHNIIKQYQIEAILHIGFEAPIIENIIYKFLDIEDNTQSVPQLEKMLPSLLTWIDEQLVAKRRVLIACSAGRSRSVTICLAYLMKKRKMTYDQAYEFISSRRSIGPNPGYIQMLKRL